MKIKNIFDVKNSRSRGYNEHEEGEIPFISNGFDNNGIVGFVKPLPNEKVFRTTAICVSAFCEATVQKAPFLPRGNGGSSLTVLLPKEEITEEEFYWYASCINANRWRFSFGRMVIGDRICDLTLKAVPNNLKISSVQKLIPKKLEHSGNTMNIRFRLYPINRLFDIVKGTGKYFEDCKNGCTPLISATGRNNGIIGFVDLKPTFKAPAITIERVSGNAFVQLEDFATVPDDIFVLKPKQDFPIENFFYVATMFNRQKWRFNYSRKVTPTRFNKIKIPLPLKNKTQDYDYIKSIIDSTYGWDIIA